MLIGIYYRSDLVKSVEEVDRINSFFIRQTVNKLLIYNIK